MSQYHYMLDLWIKIKISIHQRQLFEVSNFLLKLHPLLFCNHSTHFFFFFIFLKKCLKYVFNIILKLNIHTWKKKKMQNRSFLWKKMRPKSVVVAKKTTSPRKIVFFQKKISSSLFVQIWSSKGVQEFF